MERCAFTPGFTLRGGAAARGIKGSPSIGGGRAVHNDDDFLDVEDGGALVRGRQTQRPKRRDSIDEGDDDVRLVLGGDRHQGSA